VTPALTSQPPPRGRRRLVLALAIMLAAGTATTTLAIPHAIAADALIRTLEPLPPLAADMPLQSEASASAPTAEGFWRTDAMDPGLPAVSGRNGANQNNTGSRSSADASPDSDGGELQLSGGETTVSAPPPTAAAQLIPIGPAASRATGRPPMIPAHPNTGGSGASPLSQAPAPWPANPPPTNATAPSTATAPDPMDSMEVIAPIPRSLPVGVHRDGDLIIATVGKAIEIPVDEPFQDVVVPRPAIAEVIVLQPGKVFLATRGVGSTNLLLVNGNGRVVRNIEVQVEADLNGLRQALATIIPGSRIEVTPTQGGVVLTGQVRSAIEADNVARVAAQFAGGDTGEVINSLAIAGDQQVLLNVTVAEMSRTARKLLDHNLSFNTGTGDTLFEGTSLDAIAGGPLTNIAGAIAPESGSVAITDPTGNTLNVQMLEQQNLVKVLAEPSLTAISGETANFLAGGEYPVPVDEDDDGDVIFEFKEFGVSLSFTPVVLSDNQISLRINTEVSRIADEYSFTQGTFTVPGLSVRRATSTVMLPSGGSLMIAGLLQEEDRNSVQGFPGLKDLPVLGALFRSVDFETERSELVVIVKAFKVRPREFGPNFATPVDGFRQSDDLDIYLFGQLHQRYGGGPGDGQPAFTVNSPVGYIME